VFGRSLGIAIAAHLAAVRPVAGAVLVSPYDSLTAVGKEHYPWLPVSLLLRHRFNALADASRNRMPLLAVVGEDDTIIPPERSRALFDAWAGTKTWLVVPRAGHNTLGASDVFWDGIASFLAER
ncbi:MAG TPA: alpha/beta hydrolase, partial [Casimicrobiaceae bacterium]|nr:alpha/beta hydrolase [Casimicrobiaceae bacterium]